MRESSATWFMTWEIDPFVGRPGFTRPHRQFSLIDKVDDLYARYLAGESFSVEDLLKVWNQKADNGIRKWLQERLECAPRIGEFLSQVEYRSISGFHV
jgi:hypothetical protein